MQQKARCRLEGPQPHHASSIAFSATARGRSNLFSSRCSSFTATAFLVPSLCKSVASAGTNSNFLLT